MNHRACLIRIPLAGALLTTAFLALVACGSDGGPPSPSGVLTKEDLGKAYVDSYCAAIAPCCQANAYPYDEAECRAQAPVVQAAFDTALAYAPKATFNPAMAAACFAELRAAASTCNPKQVPFNFYTHPLCIQIFRGSIQPGGECKSPLECALPTSGTVACTQDVPSSPNRCVHRLPPTEGAPCTEGNAASSSLVQGACGFNTPDFFCDERTSTCSRRFPVGQSCTDTSSGKKVRLTSACEFNGYCRLDSCLAKGGLDAACRERDECLDAFYCHPTEKKCKPRKKAGESCVWGETDSCEHECDINFKACSANDISVKHCNGGLPM